MEYENYLTEEEMKYVNKKTKIQMILSFSSVFLLLIEAVVIFFGYNLDSIFFYSLAVVFLIINLGVIVFMIVNYKILQKFIHKAMEKDEEEIV